jgi:hypothetical protein
LRVTAYAFGKKGLSIGMVNRKGLAVFQKAMDLDQHGPDFTCKLGLLARSAFGP